MESYRNNEYTIDIDHTFDDLVSLKKYISRYIKDKIRYDINNDNDLMYCLVPLDKNYIHIYLNNNDLIDEINIKIPNLIKTDYEERIFRYIDGTFKNLTNPDLINIISKYKIDDYKIYRIPRYINSYSHLMKYWKVIVN